MDSAVISAAAGMAGVLLGGAFAWFKEHIVTSHKRKADTVYLAILVTSELSRYASGCYDVASDDGTEYGQPSRDGVEYVATATAPDFRPQELDVEWRLLPSDVLYPLLTLPDEQEMVERHLSSIMKYDWDYPDHTEYFWVRRSGYATLGLKAEKLIGQLRARAGLPPEAVQAEEWSREQGLNDVVELIDKQREKHRLLNLGSSLDLDFG